LIGRGACDMKGGLAAAILALEAVRRIDLLFDVERVLNGKPAAERLAVRRDLSAPLVAELDAWMREHRPRLSRHDDVAKAMDYMLKRWPVFTRFLDDGRVCLTNNAAERALRGIALGRKSWLFAGSDRADVLARIAGTSQSRLSELLPWNWKAQSARLAA